MIRCASSIFSCYHSPSSPELSQVPVSPLPSTHVYPFWHSYLLHLYIFNSFQLLWNGMQFGHHFGILEVLLVVLHEELAGMFVEGTFREGHNQQTLDHF